MLSQGRKEIDKSAQNLYSVMSITCMTTKTTLQTLYVHVILNSVIFPQILYIVPYAQHFLPVKFFPKYSFN